MAELNQGTVTVIPPGELLPAEYHLILKIRDLWANGNTDDEVRDLLSIPKGQWDLLMQIMIELSKTDRDNNIQYEKYKVKTIKRAKDLESLRLMAEGNEELSTAVKCHQLAAEMDKNLIEVGQKLSVLKGEVIKIQGEVKHDLGLAQIFAHLPPEKQKEAEKEMTELGKMLIDAGVQLDDAGTASSHTQ